MTIDRYSRRLPALALLAAIAPALGGCLSGRSDVTGSVYPNDVRDRHPIILADAARTLDLFPQGQDGIDYRQRGDLRGFLAEYQRYGTGPLVAQVPAGAGGPTGRALAVIRESAGGGRISVAGYEPVDPAVASPIRLSFKRLQAGVSDRCGLWPQDLGVTDVAFSYANRPYWNFGCAMQANVAAQVADPVDLVRGRPETPPDTIRRMGNIDKLRNATDPSTIYRQDGQNKISTGVGN